MSKTVLLEYIDEFEAFQGFLTVNGLDLHDFTIIALEYKLQAHLTQRLVPHQSTLPFLGNRAFERILLHFETIRSYIEKRFSFTDEQGISDAYVTELQHYMELSFNYSAKILEILSAILKQDRNLELYTFAGTRLSNSVFITHDRLLNLLAGQFAEKNNIPHHTFGPRHEEGPGALQRVFDRYFFYGLYPHLLSFLIKYLRVLKKPVVLVPTTTYEFKHLLGGIKKRNRRVAFIVLSENERANLLRKYGGLLSGFFSKVFYVDIDAFSAGIASRGQKTVAAMVLSLFDHKSEAVFTFCGIDLRVVLKEKAEAGFVQHLQTMLRRSHQIDSFTRQFDVKLFMSPFGRGLWYIIAELFRKKRQVSLFVSHGTHPVPAGHLHELSIFNMCRGFMLGAYTHIAVSTPVQEAHLHYFKGKYAWLQNSEIRTGPLIFARVTDKARRENRAALGFAPHETVIVHAVSLKLKGSERYYFLETADEFFSGLSDLVSAVNRINAARLIIRLHPGFDLTDEELSLFLPASDKYSVSKSGEFGNILAAADILVSYSSTTIDEALLNSIPVLLYDKWNRYNHFNTAPYDGPESKDIFPVCYVNEQERLQSALEFMIHKVKATKKGDIDLTNFKYNENLEKNFYAFISECLHHKGG